MGGISVMQIKLWVGDLYIANKMLEEEVAALQKENHELKQELKNIKDPKDLEVV